MVAVRSQVAVGNHSRVVVVGDSQVVVDIHIQVAAVLRTVVDRVVADREAAVVQLRQQDNMLSRCSAAQDRYSRRNRAVVHSFSLSRTEIMKSRDGEKISAC